MAFECNGKVSDRQSSLIQRTGVDDHVLAPNSIDGNPWALFFYTVQLPCPCKSECGGSVSLSFTRPVLRESWKVL